MHRSLRHSAVLLALAATLLRVLVPAGWMPSASDGAFVMLCTANGLVQVLDPGSAADGGDAPGSHAPAADGACPFGASAAPGLPGDTVQFTVSGIPSGIPVPSTRTAHQSAPATGFHSPRAPPLPQIA